MSTALRNKVIQLEKEVAQLDRKLKERERDSIMSALSAYFETAVVTTGSPFMYGVHMFEIPPNVGIISTTLKISSDFNFQADRILLHLIESTDTRLVIDVDNTVAAPVYVRFDMPNHMTVLSERPILWKHFACNAGQPFKLESSVHCPKRSQIVCNFVNNSNETFYVDCYFMGIHKR